MFVQRQAEEEAERLKAEELVGGVHCKQVCVCVCACVCVRVRACVLPEII